ncbi:MAG: exodeoxyribonuclease VII large subunit, partial [Gammaproteobacteria bacterium]|nr:exodeoxyribonuclease VII large subunit [Gammaproteobacteria bacterium]
LEAVSPTATLGRGYAILSEQPGGKLIRSVMNTAPGRKINARLVDGNLHCTVDKQTD